MLSEVEWITKFVELFKEFYSDEDIRIMYANQAYLENPNRTPEVAVSDITQAWDY